jgi:3-hydroxyisobutyrate dehydrogenase
MTPKIAFVGVGRMGANMARRLRETGHVVTAVHDRDPVRAATLASEIGSKAATSLAQVTALADVIFTVVTDDRSQLDVFAEPGDSLLTAARGKTFINCATITPATHVEVERRAPR